MIAQITAIVLGTLVATSEYGTGVIRATLAATPGRGAVLAAKALVVSSTLFVVGTVTAFAGYFARQLRSWPGRVSGSRSPTRACCAQCSAAASTWPGSGCSPWPSGCCCGTPRPSSPPSSAWSSWSGQMAWLLPGSWGEWVAKVMPGNAGSGVAAPVSFNPNLLGPWSGFAVFAGEVAVLLLVALLVFRRRDA